MCHESRDKSQGPTALQSNDTGPFVFLSRFGCMIRAGRVDVIPERSGKHCASPLLGSKGRFDQDRVVILRDLSLMEENPPLLNLVTVLVPHLAGIAASATPIEVGRTLSLTNQTKFT